MSAFRTVGELTFAQMQILPENDAVNTAAQAVQKAAFRSPQPLLRDYLFT